MLKQRFSCFFCFYLIFFFFFVGSSMAFEKIFIPRIFNTNWLLWLVSIWAGHDKHQMWQLLLWWYAELKMIFDKSLASGCVKLVRIFFFLFFLLHILLLLLLLFLLIFHIIYIDQFVVQTTIKLFTLWILAHLWK